MVFLSFSNFKGGFNKAKFLKEIGKSEYINTNYVRFLYNASQLEFGDETKIEEKFRDHLPNPVLTVIDTYGHPL